MENIKKIRFNEDEKTFIKSEAEIAGRKEAEKSGDIYFQSIQKSIKDLPGNVTDEMIKKVIIPMDDKYCSIINDMKVIISRLSVRVVRHEWWLWGLTFATAIIIGLIIILFSK